MSASTTVRPGDAIVIGAKDGLAEVTTETPLTKLNFFDGRYLRAADLIKEQRYHESRVELAARSMGNGVVYGLGVAIPDKAGSPLKVEPGLAFNGAGEVVLLQREVIFQLEKLIEATQKGAGSAGSASGSPVNSTAIERTSATDPVYVITIAPLPANCGREDVYGRLCEAACVQGTETSLIISGVILRARPVNLALPPVAGANDGHLRSRLATAWFRREAVERRSLLTAGGLARKDWCGTAAFDEQREIPLAVALLRNSAWIAVDQWAARRERMLSVPQGYWRGRLGMRRDDAFMAEVLQFQCQLSDALDGGVVASAVPPPSSDVLCAELIGKLSLTELQRKQLDELVNARRMAPPAQMPNLGWLFRKGFVELPPAGFLPVDPKSSASVREQVGAHLGAGISFELLTAPADVIPHAFEEARDMRRVPLVPDLLPAGEPRPELQVYVPDGEIKAITKEELHATHATLLDSKFALAALLLATQAKYARDLKTPLVSNGDYKPGIAALLSVSAENDTLKLKSIGMIAKEGIVPADKGAVAAKAKDVGAGKDLGPVIGGRVVAKGDLLEKGSTKIDFDASWVVGDKAEKLGLKLEIDAEGQENISDIAGALRQRDTVVEGWWTGTMAVTDGQSSLLSVPDSGTVRRSDLKMEILRLRLKEGEPTVIVVAANLFNLSSAGGDRPATDDDKTPLRAILVFQQVHGSFLPVVIELFPKSPERDLLQLIVAHWEKIRARISEGPEGGIIPIEKAGIGDLNGDGFVTLLEKLAKVSPELAKEVRGAFTKIGMVSQPAVMAKQDWVMFRRSRAVVGEPVFVPSTSNPEPGDLVPRTVLPRGAGTFIPRFLEPVPFNSPFAGFPGPVVQPGPFVFEPSLRPLVGPVPGPDINPLVNPVGPVAPEPLTPSIRRPPRPNG